MPNFIFNPETFVTPGHGSDPGEWNDDDRKDITTLRYLYPEIAHWGDLAIGSAFGSYSFDILEVQWAEWMIKRKHPANTALPSGPISLNLVPT
ncbi:hypothetical protein M214_4210 [Acinetobacter baumannii CI86]|nr:MULTISPECIES: hypothetical protein [Acinetobacter]EJP48517.1 hypothetical protein ACINNAV18_B0028 [Acinetobacter baumannii Naval-18]ETR81979.1 hypothetical protein M212_4154 [Acinetobacter baumannii CI79]ETR92873.1 hypothetical protein M214_4210 [Acinetobacter baumannii CI86]RSF52360.1 hypothetical protein EGS71_00185 [Acinetobacter sp. FDAARGOS_559]